MSRAPLALLIITDILTRGGSRPGGALTAEFE
jgi:hypothetical protein